MKALPGVVLVAVVEKHAAEMTKLLTNSCVMRVPLSSTATTWPAAGGALSIGVRHSDEGHRIVELWPRAFVVLDAHDLRIEASASSSAAVTEMPNIGARSPCA